MTAPIPGTVEYLREALDYIDGHDPEDASRIAGAALAGRWRSPECCHGHGLERRESADNTEESVHPTDSGTQARPQVR